MPSREFSDPPGAGERAIRLIPIGGLLIGDRLVRAGLACGELTEARNLHPQVDENVIIFGANHVATFYTV